MFLGTLDGKFLLCMEEEKKSYEIYDRTKGYFVARKLALIQIQTKSFTGMTKKKLKLSTIQFGLFSKEYYPAKFGDTRYLANYPFSRIWVIITLAGQKTDLCVDRYSQYMKV